MWCLNLLYISIGESIQNRKYPKFLFIFEYFFLNSTHHKTHKPYKLKLKIGNKIKKMFILFYLGGMEILFKKTEDKLPGKRGNVMKKDLSYFLFYLSY